MPPAEQLHNSFDTYRRTYNDTATWLAETLDGSMMTPFEYTYDGTELFADDGSALGGIFHAAERDAVQLAARDPRFTFELRRRRLELGEYSDMLKMARGEQPNTMIVLSDFPLELMSSLDDVGGYNVTRKQTMLRVLAWDGRKMTMYSQSLNASNRQALEALYDQFGVKAEPGELLGQRIHIDCDQQDQQYLTNRLTGVYDRSMHDQYGGNWYAGRKNEQHDTYQFVLSQHELIDHFANRFMHHAPSDQDRYNLAALMEKRFNAFKNPQIAYDTVDIALSAMRPHDLDWQLQQAGSQAMAAGKTYSGCGISVGAVGSGAEGQLSAAGYGNTSEDKFGSLTFTCTKGHYNTRPYGKLIDSCRQCGEDVSCKVPEKPRKKVADTRTWKTIIGIKADYEKPQQPKSAKHPEVGKKVLAGIL